MITGELTHRRVAIHVRTQGKYLIAGLCKVRQHNGAWKPGVIYQSMETNEVYVRTETEFRAKFEDPK
jgi:hypothetical protein